MRMSLRICPACREPLRTHNGEILNTLTFWGDPNDPYVTPHDAYCALRGVALP